MKNMYRTSYADMASNREATIAVVLHALGVFFTSGSYGDGSVSRAATGSISNLRSGSYMLEKEEEGRERV